MKTPDSLSRRFLRKLICTGRRHGLSGAPGRWAGESGFWRLNGGPRIIIDQPAEYIQQQILYHGIYEAEVALILELAVSADELLVDVGANIGQHTLLAAYRGARVHAFEPLPRLADQLRRSIVINNLDGRAKVFNVALSNSLGTATLFEASRDDDGSHSLIGGIQAKRIDELVVETTSVDVHLHQSGLRAAVFKIDVEGAEALVLDGASHTLDVDRPVIVIETGDRLADQIGESAASVLRRLSSRDYFLFHIHAVAPFLSPLQITEVTGELANYLAVHSQSPKLNLFRQLCRSGHTIPPC